MSEEIKVGDKFQWGENFNHTIEIVSIVGKVARWTGGKSSEPTATLSDIANFVKTGHWRKCVSAVVAPQSSHDDAAAETIRGMLPNELKGLRLYDAIRQLVQVYVARKCDSDSATTVQELRALVDRMRRERIASVLPPKEEIMSDNEYTEPSP